MPLTDLTLIKGVGPSTGKHLTQAGFTTVADIAGAELVKLAGVHGIGALRAAVLRDAARAAVDAVVASEGAGSVKKDKSKKEKAGTAKKAKGGKKSKDKRPGKGGKKSKGGKKKEKTKKEGKGKKKEKAKKKGKGKGKKSKR